MYLQFYHLREYPFSLGCDERFFYESAGHAEALANMMYTVQQRKGMVLITGEVGAGKTFVGRVLRTRLGPGFQVVLLQNPPQSGKQLLAGLCRQLSLTPPAGADKLMLAERLQEYLVSQHHRGRLVVLILDEAQGLSTAALEEVRLLWNWEEEGQRLVQIVLIGQPELREAMREPRWEPLRQRIVLTYHLRNLSAEDTAAYVRHRLGVASEGQASVEFTPEALQRVHQATDGIPRLINGVCDNALLVGYARGTLHLDPSVVDEVLRTMTCWEMARGMSR